MKRTLDEYLEVFVDATAQHYEATLEGNWRKTNCYAREFDTAFRHIIEFGNAGRESLPALTENANPAVAEMAAVYSMKYGTQQALATLRRISQEPGILGFGAQQAILRWEEGAWQLE
jgi:hypothetical protein